MTNAPMQAPTLRQTRAVMMAWFTSASCQALQTGPLKRADQEPSRMKYRPRSYIDRARNLFPKRVPDHVNRNRQVAG